MSQYKITVTLKNPSTDETVKRRLKAVFTTNEHDYGNGTYLGIYWDNDILYRLFDLRYDNEFLNNAEFEYLCMVLRNIWIGKNGSWRVTEVDNLVESYKVEY